AAPQSPPGPCGAPSDKRDKVHARLPTLRRRTVPALRPWRAQCRAGQGWDGVQPRGPSPNQLKCHSNQKSEHQSHQRTTSCFSSLAICTGLSYGSQGRVANRAPTDMDTSQSVQARAITTASSGTCAMREEPATMAEMHPIPLEQTATESTDD